MLTIKEFRQRVFDEIQNAEQWIKEKCEGYEEVIICSDHYPFGNDVPVCFWIQKTPRLISFQSYDADWDLFQVDYLPNRIITSVLHDSEAKSCLVKYTKGNYGQDAAEVNPFEFVKEKFKDKSCVNGGCSIFELLNNRFSYMMDDDSYEEYLKYNEEEGKDTEENRAVYNLTDFSRTVNDNDYCGTLYLNLYLVARR